MDLRAVAMWTRCLPPCLPTGAPPLGLPPSTCPASAPRSCASRPAPVPLAGRYLATIVSSPQAPENGFQVWSFAGQPLYKVNKERFFQVRQGVHPGCCGCDGCDGAPWGAAQRRVLLPSGPSAAAAVVGSCRPAGGRRQTEVGWQQAGWEGWRGEAKRRLAERMEDWQLCIAGRDAMLAPARLPWGSLPASSTLADPPGPLPHPPPVPCPVPAPAERSCPGGRGPPAC